jgi:GT2 family glycosyltransferase
MPRNDGVSALGVVAIGRNEGERLVHCLRSARAQCPVVVYVDSGSRDGSLEAARSLGVEVVDLDLSVPFTAARARNEGLKRLRELHPETEFVQFVDGDCELRPGWIPSALEAIGREPSVAVVCGRRRERYRDETIYNRLCDLEWDTPVGEAEACGGDALMRVRALDEVRGFDPGLIAGEEPDLCFRLRGRGHRILRIDAEMTLHDAAMRRASQWWRRMIRSGYAAGESVGRRGLSAPAVDRGCVRGVVLWIPGLPVLTAGACFVLRRIGWAHPLLSALALALLAVVAQTVRIAVNKSRTGTAGPDARLYAASCMVAKLPQCAGILQYLGNRLRGSTPELIEYK